ncbi:LysR family transcriptional regulator [Cereibacter sphaeroides]|nr:LysR family transcriptional regulator [Cereibacter sphaeroides]
MSLPEIPDLSTRQIQAVLAVAEYRSFIAAAADLRISQPALTRMIQRLCCANPVTAGVSLSLGRPILRAACRAFRGR